MRKNLLSRINLESEEAAAEAALAAGETAEEAVSETVESVAQVAEAEQQVEVASGELISLESAFDTLMNLESAVEELVEEKGVDETVVAETMIPVAVEVIASIDEEVADETSEEAEIALEAEGEEGGAKAAWGKVKERAKQIWEAIKAAIQKVIVWLKEMLDRKTFSAKRLKTAAASVIASIGKLPQNNWNTREVKLLDSWSKGDAALDANGIKSAIETLSRSADASGKAYRASSSKLGELIQSLANASDREALVAGAEAELKALTEKDTSLTASFNKLIEAGGIGLSVKDGKVAGSKAPADAKITTAPRDVALSIAESVARIATVVAQAIPQEDKIVKALNSGYAEFEKAVKVIEDEAEATKFRERAQVFRKVVDATMKAARSDLNSGLLKAATNALSFAKASLDGATKAPAAPAKDAGATA